MSLHLTSLAATSQSVTWIYLWVCALNFSVLNFSLHFHNSENILLTMNHLEYYWGILTHAATSTILHESWST